MKKIILAIVALLVSFLLTVCSSYKGGYAARERSSSWPPRGKTKDSQERPRPSPGQLTSGEWSDIKNYEFYLNLFNITNDPDIEESQRRNSFEEFINYFGFETRYMFTVNVIRGGLPAGDAVVELYDSNQDILFSAKTDVRGSAYLFPSYNLSGENITVKVRSGSYEFTRQFNNAQDNLQITLDNGAAGIFRKP